MINDEIVDCYVVALLFNYSQLKVTAFYDGVMLKCFVVDCVRRSSGAYLL